MTSIFKLLGITLWVGCLSLAGHAIPKTGQNLTRGQILMRDGALQAGRAGVGFSLLRLEIRQLASSAAQTPTEEIRLHLGDRVFRDLSGDPGYHHLERKGQQVLLTLYQTMGSKLSEAQIKKIFESSKNFDQVSTFYNSQGNNFIIKLRLKNPQLGLELRPLRGTKGNTAGLVLRTVSQAQK